MPRITVNVPDELVPRFRAILPPELTPEEAILKLIKLAILDTEAKAFAQSAGQQLDQSVRAKRQALQAELNL
jgi:hypothetical protein